MLLKYNIQMILFCINGRESRPWETIAVFFSTLVKLYLLYYVLVWVPNFKKINPFECIQKRTKWKMFCKLLFYDENIHNGNQLDKVFRTKSSLLVCSLKVWFVPLITQQMPA